MAFVFTGVGRGAPDPTCTVHVKAGVGHPIQDAINAAAPGATICVDKGIYHENVIIANDGITLKGAGPGLTVLEPPAKQVQLCATINIEPIGYANFGPSGICVGDLDADGDILRAVNDVRVTGFTVHGFPGVGIIFAGANRFRADHNVAANNTSYGITAFSSTHGLYEYNVSYGSEDAGFYIGNSPNADLTIQYNTAFADLWGILVRDASTGTIRNNLLHDSCSGLVFLNSGTSTGVHNWRASYNIVAHNDAFCPAGDLPFTLTGVGVLIAGGDHILLRENRVRENKPGGDQAFSMVSRSPGVSSSSLLPTSPCSRDSTEAWRRTTSSWTILYFATNCSTSSMTAWARTTTSFPIRVTHLLPPGYADERQVEPYWYFLTEE